MSHWWGFADLPENVEYPYCSPEDDDWNLRFYDCGNLNILIDKTDLRNLAFEKVQAHCHSL